MGLSDAMGPDIDSRDELICLGHGEDLPAQGGAMAPPIVQTSLFAQESLEDLAAGLAGEHRRHIYSRGQNPTVEAVESKLAQLERGDACKVFGSGMAAISAVMMSLLESGDHILFVNQIYGPTLQLARRLERFGIEHDIVLDLDLNRIEDALAGNTRLIWVESPGTMTCRLLDLPALASLARDRGIATVVDNSWATPLFQKPLEMGVDLVVHSATKYLGGHSDLVAGAVIGSEALLERIFYDAYLLLGGILAPFDAWLLNRGIRTLPARMRLHHANGLAVAAFLEDHVAVRRVFHPALEPDRGLVEAQLAGFSGLLGVDLVADRYRDLAAFVDRLKLFHIGVSWGGVESLVITPRRSGNAEKLASRGIPPGLVRLSVGLESPEALISDLDAALKASRDVSRAATTG